MISKEYTGSIVSIESIVNVQRNMGIFKGYIKEEEENVQGDIRKYEYVLEEFRKH